MIPEIKQKNALELYVTVVQWVLKKPICQEMLHGYISFHNMLELLQVVNVVKKLYIIFA